MNYTILISWFKILFYGCFYLVYFSYVLLILIQFGPCIFTKFICDMELDIYSEVYVQIPIVHIEKLTIYLCLVPKIVIGRYHACKV